MSERNLSSETVSLPKQPERLTAGRYGEVQWGYDGDIGTYHEMGLRYERACKDRAVKALERIVEEMEEFECGHEEPNPKICCWCNAFDALRDIEERAK